MAKKISNKDIFEDGLFSPAVKNAEELNLELDKLEAGLKGIAAVVKKDLKNIEQYFSNDFKCPTTLFMAFQWSGPGIDI